MKILDNKYISLVARIVLGLIFIFFGIEKVMDASNFAEEIVKYHLFPEFSLNLIAIVLPWIELIAGLLLLLGIRIKSNSLLISILLIVFSLAIIIAMAQGLDIYCGCSKINPEKVGIPKLMKNLGMLILSLLLYYFPNSEISLEKLIKENVD